MIYRDGKLSHGSLFLIKYLIKIKYFNVKSVLGTVISLVGDSYKSVCEKFMIFFFLLRSQQKKNNDIKRDFGLCTGTCALATANKILRK
jgi:hypothetical protein